MTRATTERIQEGSRCVLRLSGDLDVAAATELAEALAGETAQQLLVDFFAVATIDDRGLADLADALRARPGVHLRGLRGHQLRLLAYLGVEQARGGGQN
jgi:anti-anti-sigma regulatory factor